MARLLNSRCDFENGFFTCNLPEDAVLLILKVKTKTGNHTLVEDRKSGLRSSACGRKKLKIRNKFPKKLPGVSTPRKNDNSVTSDSGPCPGPTEHEYKPRYFDEPDCLSSNKENMPPIESNHSPFLKKSQFGRGE